MFSIENLALNKGKKGNEFALFFEEKKCILYSFFYLFNTSQFV